MLFTHTSPTKKRKKPINMSPSIGANTEGGQKDGRQKQIPKLITIIVILLINTSNNKTVNINVRQGEI